MSRAYDAAGKRISSKVHARRGHSCSFCDKVSFGNGGQVAHARTHVRSGEAVELVKDLFYPFPPSRIFLPAGNDDQIARFVDDGYAIVPPKAVP
jgi:hypothetical protein